MKQSVSQSVDHRSAVCSAVSALCRQRSQSRFDEKRRFLLLLASICPEVSTALDELLQQRDCPDTDMDAERVYFVLILVALPLE